MPLPSFIRRRCRCLLAAVWVLACAAPAAAQITLDSGQIAQLGLQSEKAVAAQGVPLDRLPAEIVAPLLSGRTVSVPFAGVVAQVGVDEGVAVRPGMPLVRVQSRDYLAAQTDLRRSASDTALAQSQARRDDALLAEGIIARSRTDESRARAADAQARLAQARGVLMGVGETPVAGEYELRAPVAARVLRRLVAPGQEVAAFEPVFVLAVSDDVEVLFQAPAEWRAALTPGLAVEMEDGARGVVTAVAAAADAGSQSLRLRARLAGPVRWLVGQRTTVRLELPAPPGAVRAPLSALLSDGARTLVFVTDGAHFSAVPVERLGADAHHAVIRASVPEALRAGDAVVVSGASSLKPLLEK